MIMTCTFAYARVSTNDQDPTNQIREIKEAGFAIEPHRILTETLSGSMPMARRKGFSSLLEKMEKGDILAVTKLDRLGRDAIDGAAGRSNMKNIYDRLLIFFSKLRKSLCL